MNLNINVYINNSQYEWERDGKDLPPLAEVEDNHLVLLHTRSDDSGRYICRSFAEDGTESQNYVDLVIKSEYRRRRQSYKNRRNNRRRRGNTRK